MPTREQARSEAPPAAEGREKDVERQGEPTPGATGTASSTGVTGKKRFFPALLRPFRQNGAVRLDYPIFLAPLSSSSAEIGEEATEEASTWELSPLPNLLSALLPEEPAARILRDNILRFERALRAQIAESATASEPLEVLPLLRRAAERTRSELALGADDDAALQADLEAFLARVPEGSRFEPLSQFTPLHLLVRAASRRWAPARREFTARAADLAQKLRAILEIDHGKRPEGRNADALRGGMGALGGRFIDSSLLAEALGEQRGSAPLDPERRAEIEAAAQTLESVADDAKARAIVVSDSALPDLTPLAGGEIEAIAADDPCRKASSRFAELAAEAAEIVRAARFAERMIANDFVPGRDRPLLERLDWRSFEDGELALIPPVLVWTSATTILRHGLLELSRLLLSGMPIQLLMTLDPAQNATAMDEVPAGLGQFRFEPSYLALAHRQAFVQQTSAARPGHMSSGFERALGLSRTAFHVVASLPAAQSAGSPAWLVAQAAIEGRAHPLFRYDPTAGSSWAQRFDLADNPQSERPWPAYPADWTDDGDGEDEEVAFTFADFALLDPRLAFELEPIPNDFDEHALAPLAEWLELAPEERRGTIPFIWGADEAEGETPLRLALSRPLALACQDRIAFWRTLQELGGVHNEYVEHAVELARQEERAEAELRMEEIEKQHADELEALRTTAAEELVDNLIGGLLATDASAWATASSPPPNRAASPAEPTPAATETADGGAGQGDEMSATATAIEVPTLEEEEEGLEGYIDTELCTTCNDCINLNPLMFAYNADKKAYIKDVRAGTFQQLVLAAEKCPARIIHPGSPVNPDEPDLDSWVRRAEKFN